MKRDTLTILAYIAAIFILCIGILVYGAVQARPISSAARNVNMLGGLASAVTASGTTPTSLFIADRQTVASGSMVTVPPTMELLFVQGGEIHVESGATVRIYGPVQAGPYAIITGSGESLFGNAALNGPYCEFWRGSGETPFTYYGDGSLLTGIPTASSATPEYVPVFIASPDLLDDPTSQPFWRTNPKYAAFTLTGITVRASSAVSFWVYAGNDSQSLWSGSGVSAVVSGASMPGTASGNSSYVLAFGRSTSNGSGTTVLASNIPLILKLHEASTCNWMEIEIEGRYTGE